MSIIPTKKWLCLFCGHNYPRQVRGGFLLEYKLITCGKCLLIDKYLYDKNNNIIDMYPSNGKISYDLHKPYDFYYKLYQTNYQTNK